MKLKIRLVALAAFFVVLLGVAAWSRAQTAIVPNPVPPVVLAGPDVGFRMTGVKRGTPVGQLVVRINGEWKVVEFSSTALSLAK
ncbi:MAG TPA: hypothetical protein VGQ37_22235 [Vicinamibacterales bacterium]|jgi:hypothetical protein|nr:hypothetical protein [Vicinamibacterales bacterium]